MLRFQLLWTHWVTVQAKNSIRNSPASAALTQVSHQSHNSHTANHYLCSKGERNGTQRKAKISLGKTMIQALELLRFVKRHVSGQSDVEQWRNPSCSYRHNQVVLVWRHQVVSKCSTAQLQGSGTCPRRVQNASRMRVRRVWNIRQIHLEHTPDTSGTHARYIRNVLKMCPERAWDASMQAQSLLIQLQQNLINCHALFCQMWYFRDTCRTCLGVRGAFQTLSNITLELGCTVSLSVSQSIENSVKIRFF